MIIITKTKNFTEINSKLLSLINKIPNNSLIEYQDNITHTDYNLPKNFKREYLEYFLEFIKPYMLEISIKLHAKKIEVANAWFQQYTKNSLHHWHTHPRCHFTNIYFVELPLKSLGTEILNHNNLDLNIGDLLTFPAYYFHRSPINLSEERKTIISFNTDIYGFINKVN
jgi:hypothetical protein